MKPQWVQIVFDAVNSYFHTHKFLGDEYKKIQATYLSLSLIAEVLNISNEILKYA